MSLRAVQENFSYLETRFVVVIAVVAFFFLIVIARLYYLQIRHGEDYRSFAQENTLKEIRIPAIRGVIKDRLSRPIASNRPSFDLALIPQYVSEIEDVGKSLKALIRMPPERIAELWSQAKKQPAFYPFVVARDVGYDTMARIQVNQAIEDDASDALHLQGVEILPSPVRRYPKGSLAANVLGYVREASGKELKRLQEALPNTYHLGDRVGSFGLERQWEVLLRGRDGYQQKIVNAVGKEVQSDRIGFELMRQPGRAGLNLITTLDYELQAYAEQLFEDKRGALVALNPNNGEIYAIVSQPSFDLAKLVGPVKRREWSALTTNPGKVFLNRAIQAAYPPGSTYKIIAAVAALEEKVITADETVYCPGFMRFGKRKFRCWKGGGHGSVNLHQALVESCDVYFYNLGLLLGVDRLAKYARMFGLSSRTGIEVSGEVTGLIPTKAWKQRNRSKKWRPGETLSAVIGQGYNLVTPLQNAVMVSAIANGGARVVPTLTRYFEDTGGNHMLPPGRLLGTGNKQMSVSPQTLRAIKAALRDVVADTNGTARRLQSLPVAIAGKTGTAQVVGRKKKSLDAAHRDHSLFVGFAPVKRPQIAVSVIVEHGGHGSAVAAPIAGEVIQKFMELRSGYRHHARNN